MADLNNFTFTGRLTRDAQIRTLASGKTLLVADVAVNTGFGDYKKTLFIKVNQWGERGENIVQYLTKGSLVGGTGELSRSEWQNNEGREYVDFVVTVQSIQLLGNKNDSRQFSTKESIEDTKKKKESVEEVAF